MDGHLGTVTEYFYVMRILSDTGTRRISRQRLQYIQQLLRRFCTVLVAKKHVIPGELHGAGGGDQPANQVCELQPALRNKGHPLDHVVTYPLYGYMTQLFMVAP